LTCVQAATLSEIHETKVFGAYFVVAWCFLGRFLESESGASGGHTFVPFEGEKTTWHDGFDRYDYVMDEGSFAITPFKRPDAEEFAVGNPAKGQRRCIVVVPKTVAPGRPWSWQGCYWDHEPQTEVELLRRGFHIAFITPDPGKQWDTWYAWLTEKHGLSKKPAFVGMSRGGVNEYDWTTANPDKSFLYLCGQSRDPSGSLREARRAGAKRCGVAEHLWQRGLAAPAEYAGDRESLSTVGRTHHGHDQGRSCASSAQPARSRTHRRLDRRAYAAGGCAA
jgi:hypothetical protein